MTAPLHASLLEWGIGFMIRQQAQKHAKACGLCVNCERNSRADGDTVLSKRARSNNLCERCYRQLGLELPKRA